MGARGRPGSAGTALDRALRLLARRPRTVAELRGELSRRGIGRAEVDRVVEALSERGLLDDAVLAREFIATRSARLGHGRLRLLADLVRRGVAREVAEAAWAAAVRSGEVDPLDAARRAAGRAVLRAGGRLDRRSYARVYNALLRRGFDAETVEAALAGHRAAAGPRDEGSNDVP